MSDRDSSDASDAGSGGIRAAKARHEARLLALPGVVSVGIGRGASGELVIVVGLAADNPQLFASVPADVEGFPVVPEVVGVPRAE